MTEEEWLASNDHHPMLEFFAGKASERKLRLFACAWCRSLHSFLADQRSKQALEIGEAYVEGLVTEADRAWACKSAQQAVEDAVADQRWNEAVAARDSRKTVEIAKDRIVGVDHRYSVQEQQQQCQIIRDIFHNPFRPVTFDPTWRTLTAVAIAQTIYDDRTFQDLAVLADALEEAGCNNPDILNHCRQPGEHVRGCWLVDLILGKE